MAASVTLDDSLYMSVLHRAGEPPSLGAFTAELRRALKAGTPVAMPGLELSRSLEALLKVAKLQLETGPELGAVAHVADEAGYEAAIKLADAALSTGVWLQSVGAPGWLFPMLDAPAAFALLAERARDAGKPREALHWLVALLLAPATLLRTPGSVDLERRHVELLLAVQRELGPSALQDEFEAWRDLYAGYRLLRSEA